MTLDDQASDKEMLDRELSLRHYRKPSAPPPCGQCFNCSEPLRGDMRWCDADCREDWENRQ